MADIDNLNQLMKGIPHGEIKKTEHRWEEYRRNLSVPVGMRTLWAVFHPGTHEAVFVRSRRVLSIDITDAWCQQRDPAGSIIPSSVKRELRTLVTGPDDVRPDPDPVTQEGYEVERLTGQTDAPFLLTKESLIRRIIFDTSGTLITSWSRVNGYSRQNEERVAEYHQFVDMLQSLHDVAAELPKVPNSNPGV